MQPLWTRYQFTTASPDPRPLEWPIMGTYWITGEAADGSYTTIVALLRSNVDIEDYWPEATNLTSMDIEAVTFSSRFPKPADWIDTLKLIAEKELPQ